MNEIDRWIYLDGPEPASFRPLFDAMRLDVSPPSTVEENELALASLIATLDARLGPSPERWAEEALREEAGDEASPESDVPRTAMLPPSQPRSVDELEAASRGEAPLGFEGWAELSFRLLGASEEEAAATLSARHLTVGAWEAIDDDYLDVLSTDLASGREERQALYAAACDAEIGRRRRSVETSGGERGEAVAPPAAPGQAASPLAGTADMLDFSAEELAAKGRLPFVDPSSIPDAARRKAPKTLQGAVTPNPMGETLSFRHEDVIQKPIAVTPFVGSGGAVGVIEFPYLSVDHYVRLRAELLARPDLRAEALRRYKVPNEAAYQAMEGAWREQFVKRADLLAAYDAALMRYLAALRGW